MHAAQGRPRTVLVEQPRAWAVWAGRMHAPWGGQAQCGWDTASTRQCYLSAASLPPHSTTEQVSLKKCPPPPPCVRADNHWTTREVSSIAFCLQHLSGTFHLLPFIFVFIHWFNRHLLLNARYFLLQLEGIVLCELNMSQSSYLLRPSSHSHAPRTKWTINAFPSFSYSKGATDMCFQ